MSNTSSDSPPQPSGSSAPAEASPSEPAWMIEPSTSPSHVKLALTGVLNAGEIRPDVLQSLARIAEEIQNSKHSMVLNFCPKLTECVTFLDDGTGCPSLRKCGNYKLAP